MLKAENLQLGYGKLPDVIQDVSFRLAAGEVMTLIGPNGSGKSTVLRALAAALRPRSGMVYLDGKSIHKYPPKSLARNLAFLPQTPKVPADFTVRDLVSYGRYPYLKWGGHMRPADWEIVDWAIGLTRLKPLEDRMVSSLSGGERQRAWIAMALAQKPRILLLDEPTTFLDICYQFEVLELVKDLNVSLGITTVMVLHDLNQAARYAHTIAAVHDGRIVTSGPPGAVITPELLARIFKIRVKVISDDIHGCPFLIPIESLQGKSMDAYES